MKGYDLRKMTRADLEDEVMLLRAEVKVLRNELITVGNELHARQHDLQIQKVRDKELMNYLTRYYRYND